jgi:hypothetical protein
MTDGTPLREDTAAERLVRPDVSARRPRQVCKGGGVRLPDLGWMCVPDPGVVRAPKVERKNNDDSEQNDARSRHGTPLSIASQYGRDSNVSGQMIAYIDWTVRPGKIENVSRPLQECNLYVHL